MAAVWFISSVCISVEEISKCMDVLKFHRLHSFSPIRSL